MRFVQLIPGVVITAFFLVSLISLERTIAYSFVMCFASLLLLIPASMRALSAREKSKGPIGSNPSNENGGNRPRGAEERLR